MSASGWTMATNTIHRWFFQFTLCSKLSLGLKSFSEFTRFHRFRPKIVKTFHKFWKIVQHCSTTGMKITTESVSKSVWSNVGRRAFHDRQKGEGRGGRRGTTRGGLRRYGVKCGALCNVAMWFFKALFFSFTSCVYVQKLLPSSVQKQLILSNPCTKSQGRHVMQGFMIMRGPFVNTNLTLHSRNKNISPFLYFCSISLLQL